MRFAARFSIRASALVCMAAAFLSADTLTLRSGETIQGTYLGGTARQVRMDLNGEIRTFDITQVPIGHLRRPRLSPGAGLFSRSAELFRSACQLVSTTGSLPRGGGALSGSGSLPGAFFLSGNRSRPANSGNHDSGRHSHHHSYDRPG